MAIPTDLSTLLRALEAGASFRYRFFWGHRAKPGAISDACFSQWWPCSFQVEGERFSSAEQFMMAGKAALFGDDEVRAEILAASDPKRIKELGRKVRGFDEATWSRARFDLVTAGNIAKFEQTAPLRDHLLSTREELLVEASPVDAIWGIGLPRDDPRATDPRKWAGLNLLGFALVRARAVLRGEAPRL